MGAQLAQCQASAADRIAEQRQQLEAQLADVKNLSHSMATKFALQQKELEDALAAERLRTEEQKKRSAQMTHSFEQLHARLSEALANTPGRSVLDLFHDANVQASLIQLEEYEVCVGQHSTSGSDPHTHTHTHLNPFTRQLYTPIEIRS